MRRMTMALCMAALLSPEAAGAADFSDPTWPCIQRKVPRLSIGQMWAGPLPEEGATVDADTGRLASAIAVRRTGLEEAERLIARHAASLDGDPERNARLAALFGAVFERIDRERSAVIGGIGRYAEKQTALAARIDAQQQQVAALDAKGDGKTNDEWDRMEELQDIATWDARIYKERAQSLTYVCETPVLLEKRAFALARMVMNELE